MKESLCCPTGPSGRGPCTTSTLYYAAARANYTHAHRLALERTSLYDDTPLLRVLHFSPSTAAFSFPMERSGDTCTLDESASEAQKQSQSREVRPTLHKL